MKTRSLFGALRGTFALGTAVAVTAVLAACAGGGAVSGGAPVGAETETAAGACGVIPNLPPNDPEGVLSQFDESVVSYYNGFPNPVLPSAWSDWKPDHDGPYTAALVTNPRNNPFQINLIEGATAALEEAGIEIVADLAAPDEVDVATQAQQFQQALSLDPDIILLGALAPEPAIEMVESAAAEGIPVVSMHLSSNSDKAVSVSFNNVLDAMATGAGVASALGGEGTILRVHGIPGIAQDNEASVGFDAVLESCPEITEVGEINGMYQTSQAQQSVVEFLATNPVGVDGVFQSGVMGLGVLQGFEQAGQPIPALADIAMSKGSLAIAAANPEMQFFGTAQPSYAMGERMGEVAARILAGQGPKVNQFVVTLPVISPDNIDTVHEDGFEVTDQSGVEGDPNDYFPVEHLDQLFNYPDLTLE